MNNTKGLLERLAKENGPLPIDLNIPDSFYQTLLEQLLERDYLSDVSDKDFSENQEMRRPQIQWIQITRLPVHPNENESYDLLSRWQGVLSSLHAWNYKLYFMLLRYDGKTKLFLGASSEEQTVLASDAVEQLREASFGSMPGIGLNTLKNKSEEIEEIVGPLSDFEHIGAVTGIPAMRDKDNSGLLQTLDALAFGIRDANGMEKNYAMLVVADPISDSEITNMIAQYRNLGSQIHTAVKKTLGESFSFGRTHNPGAAKKAKMGALGTIIGTIGGTFLGQPMIGAMIGNSITNSLASEMNEQLSESQNTNVGFEYLDKFAEYAESVTEHHIQRLNDGRNYGFWNTGIYILGQEPRDVVTVSGMLRSIYSGDESYFEPIRLHLLRDSQHALDIVRNKFNLLPFGDSTIAAPKGEYNMQDGQWHFLGKCYQYVSTPLNTKELSLATSLPRRDVPGLRFVKTAVRFANNPAQIDGDKITIGKIVDTGVVQDTTYDIDVNSLVRHAIIAGSTGSGKSTTSKKILRETIERGIPVMVIEPAKDDYVRWALELNKELPKEKQFKIYMPGVDVFEGTKIEQLRLNPFEPAAPKGMKVDLLQHAETFATLLNACLPSEEVLPIIIENAVLETISYAAKNAEIDLNDGLVKPLDKYPSIESLLVKGDYIMEKKTYAKDVKDNFKEMLSTRFNYLMRGTRGKILNVSKSVDFDELFSGNVIINISHMSGTKDKSLIMSMLMQALYEYRATAYRNDSNYREKAQQNKLLHLTLIEEAHNVLLKPQDNSRSGSPQRAAADLFGNLLSEVRGYGQGLVVVDQVPTRLIDDAIKNTNYKIVHRLTAPDDRDMMASCMAFREDQKYIIPALEKGNAIICGDEDDAAAWVKIPAPHKA
ncbi:MAG: ATP-binding protein [Clostridia bacterium]|nr:ATP-binding protein [Clostridia bacterium]